MKKKYGVLLGLIASLFLGNSAWATDWYVATTGNDANSGSVSSPKLTIQAAINAATTGDVVRVQSGTYKEAVIVNKTLTISGAGKGSNPATNTVLTPASACTGVGLTVSAANVTIQGMYVTNFEEAVVLNGAVNPTVNNMALIDYCRSGINLVGNNSSVNITQTDIQRTSVLALTVGIRNITVNAVNGMLIDNCTITGNIQGMLVTQATTPVPFDKIIIRNSAISNNTQKGVYFEKLSNALLDNLTMDNNGTDATYGFNNGIDINLKYGNYANITIQNANITNSGVNGTASSPQNTAAIAIKARDDSPDKARDDSPDYNSVPATLTGVWLKNNRITGPQNGVRFGEFDKINATPTNITLEKNDLSHAFANKAIISSINANIALNCNWHGSTDVMAITNGFLTTGGGIINLNQFLGRGTDGSPAAGFQPVSSCINAPITSGVISGGATICEGFSTNLKVTIAGGFPPYTVVYSNGNVNTTLNSYINGSNISVSPVSTTTYTLVSITDANGSSILSAGLSGSAIVKVNSNALVKDVPTVKASAEVVCTGTEVTLTTNCAAEASVLWNTGVTQSSLKVIFNNPTRQSYTARCVLDGGCQSPVSTAKSIVWKAFDLTLINIGQSKSAIKTNSKAAWASQFITADAGPTLDLSTESNPTIYHSENVNKTAPRFWTVNAETCALGTNGSLTFDMLMTPESSIVRSYNTHENHAPYFMFANREGFTELYAQNHPVFGFYESNGNGGNIHDVGLLKGLYKLGISYWDQKGQGGIYPSTRQPQGNVLAYQEFWFRIQSKDGVGKGVARLATDNEQRTTDNGLFAQVMPNPVAQTLHLKVTDTQGQKVNVSLIDASGRTLLQRAFVPETNQHQEEFNVSEMANGMYFLRVHTVEKQATLKVVKVE